MQGVFCGELGHSPEVFWRSLPREIYNAIGAYRDSETRKSRERWEIARYDWFYQVVTSMAETKAKDPRDLTPFPWDRERDNGKRMSMAEVREMINKWDGDNVKRTKLKPIDIKKMSR